jgi:hypothetical protein
VDIVYKKGPKSGSFLGGSCHFGFARTGREVDSSDLLIMTIVADPDRSHASHARGAQKWQFFGVFQASVHMCTLAAPSGPLSVARHRGYALGQPWVA